MEVYSLTFYSAIAPKCKAYMSLMPIIKKKLDVSLFIYV
jgi:hypothetical protein